MDNIIKSTEGTLIGYYECPNCARVRKGEDCQICRGDKVLKGNPRREFKAVLNIEARNLNQLADKLIEVAELIRKAKFVRKKYLYNRADLYSCERIELLDNQDSALRSYLTFLSTKL